MELAGVTQTPVPFSALGFQLYESANTWIGDTSEQQSIEYVRWYEHFPGRKFVNLPMTVSTHLLHHHTTRGTIGYTLQGGCYGEGPA